jgi:hypothetical protein
MAQPANYLTQMLPGQMFFILAAAALLAFPFSLLLLGLYRRAVLKSMDRQAGGAADIPRGDEAPAPPSSKPAAPLQITSFQEHENFPLTPDAQGHHDRAIRAPWRAAAVYLLGGAIYAVILTAAYLVSGKLAFSPLRFLLVAWIFGWPFILTLILVVGTTRCAKLLVLAYFCSYVILSAVTVAVSPKSSFLQLFALWAIFNAAPTVLALAYLTRRVRAVGPMVLTFLVIAVTGAVVLLSLVGSNESLLRRISGFGYSLGLGATSVFIGLHLIGIAAFGVLAWPLVQWIRVGYERKKISDQSLTLDSLWLLFGIVYTFSHFIFQEPLWIITGIVAFLAYKFAVMKVFAMTKAGLDLPGIRLLLLRVFALGKRSERLFDAFGARWRYNGPIQMIAGPDLATTTIAPHEFLQFLTGKLARRFIGDRKTLELRLSEMDLKPDRDWRFRVNDFFCFADTWKMVLHRLVSESDAVLMDLRSFSPERAGCIFEISELINSVSLDRAVFIVDATTDEPYLCQTIQQAWGNLRPSSPNNDSPAPLLHLFHYAGPESLDPLLRMVCAAASPIPSH